MFNPIRVAGRALLGSVFINGGINQLKAPQMIAPLVEKAEQEYGIDVPVAAKDVVTANGVAMLAGGAALALGIMPRTAALGLIASLGATNVVGHPFWKAENPGQEFEERNAFMGNAAIIGALILLVISGDGR